MYFLHLPVYCWEAVSVRTSLDREVAPECKVEVAHWHPEGAGGNIAHKLAMGKVVHCGVTHHLKCHRVWL